MKFVSIFFACLAAVAFAADDAKECEGEWSNKNRFALVGSQSMVIGIL